MITFTSKGDFKKTIKYFNRLNDVIKLKQLEHYGQRGVEALANATPKDTGKTASSWEYKIVRGEGSVSLEFSNTNVVDGVPIAVIIQYGHATRNGVYVQGVDYINPALKPIFDDISKKIWEEATK